MFAKRCNIVVLMLVLVLGLGSVSYAVMPPAPDVEMPLHIIEAQKEISQSYGESGLARKFQRLAQEKRDARDQGTALSPEVSSIAVPVLVGSYSDNANLFSAAQFQTQLFGANPSGSMTMYYNEVSYGSFTLTGTVYGPYTAAQTQAYYVNGDNGSGNDYPTNAGTVIPLAVPTTGVCEFEVFNLLGQLVYDERLQIDHPGEYLVHVDKDVLGNSSSGVYFYKLSMKQESVTRKMLLLK